MEMLETKLSLTVISTSLPGPGLMAWTSLMLLKSTLVGKLTLSLQNYVLITQKSSSGKIFAVSSRQCWQVQVQSNKKSCHYGGQQKVETSKI